MFKMGQKVVCKDASNNGRLIKGKIYTIDGMVKCDCGSINLLLLEFKSESWRLKWCNECSRVTSMPGNAFLSWRFESLKYDIVSNKEVLKEIIVEKLDISIKEPATQTRSQS